MCLHLAFEINRRCTFVQMCYCVKKLLFIYNKIQYFHLFCVFVYKLLFCLWYFKFQLNCEPKLTLFLLLFFFRNPLKMDLSGKGRRSMDELLDNELTSSPSKKMRVVSLFSQGVQDDSDYKKGKFLFLLRSLRVLALLIVQAVFYQVQKYN